MTAASFAVECMTLTVDVLILCLLVFWCYWDTSRDFDE